MKEKRNWPEIFREQANSGKTISAFCTENGIHPNSFYRQRKRFGSSDLVEIPAPQTVPGGPILLKTGQYSLAISPGFDESTLIALLATLREIG